MPNSPPSSDVVHKDCVRCSTGFTIDPRERKRLERKFGTYREPKLCLGCRKKKRSFAKMVDNIVALHAFAFGYCDTVEKGEVFKYLAQQVVLDASEAGVLDGKKLYKPVGKTEVDARLAEHIARNRVQLINDWGNNALAGKHDAAELTDIESQLRSHIDAINGLLEKYFNHGEAQ